MTKKTIMVNVVFPFEWAYGVTLEKIKEDIIKLEKLGVTEIDIEADDNWGSPCVNINAFVHRLETDSEFEIRLMKENEQEEKLKEWELKQLESLKSKYENNSNK